MATEYGQRLRAARKHAGLTQEEAGRRTGIAQSTISTAERVGNGSADTPVYAKAYGVDAHWLATGKGAMLAASSAFDDKIPNNDRPIGNKFAPSPAPTLAQALEVVMDAMAQSAAKAELKQLLPMLVETNASAYRARLAELLVQSGASQVPAAESRDFQPPVPPQIFDKTKQPS